MNFPLIVVVTKCQIWTHIERDPLYRLSWRGKLCIVQVCFGMLLWKARYALVQNRSQYMYSLSLSLSLSIFFSNKQLLSLIIKLIFLLIFKIYFLKLSNKINNSLIYVKIYHLNFKKIKFYSNKKSIIIFFLISFPRKNKLKINKF